MPLRRLGVPLFLAIFWHGGNKWGAISGMVSSFAVASVLTMVYPTTSAS
ncbi:Na+/proline symporter [Streptomyces sp. B4I13]|nr:hypothetical protein [Streptomyces sp. B4I13]MDQ0956379.1 Na+/proline symporter [Streptomyces sp. B4I13]